MSLVLSNCAFVHIPKTGGVWATQALTDSVKTVRRVAQRHDLLLNTPFPIIASVRNPVTWYQSRWASPDHQNRLKLGVPYTGLLTRAGSLGYDFNEWMNNLLEGPPLVTTLYQRFLGINMNRATYLCRNETLTEDLVAALKHFNEPFDEDVLRSTPILNNSDPSVKINTRMSQELLNKVFEKEREVFSKFGYSANFGT